MNTRRHDVALQTALRLRNAGKLTEAADLYERVLSAEPKHFEALQALGIVRYQMGQIEEAERLIGEAARVNPAVPEVFYYRGCMLQRLNRQAEALAAFTQAIALKADYFEALTNRGSMLAGFGRHEEAMADFAKAARLRANFLPAWVNLATSAMVLSRHDEAMTALDRALMLNPDETNALGKRASILLLKKRYVDALSTFQRYLALKPNDADGWNDLGILFVEMKRHDEALAAFEKTVALAPAHVDAWNNHANLLFVLKRYEESAESYEKALALAPDLPLVPGYLVHCRLRGCDWRSYEADRARIAAGLAQGRAIIDPLDNLALSHSPADQLICARLHAREERPQAPLHRGERYAHSRIRVGYLSGDFRAHAVAFLIAGVFEHHDRSHFEAFAFSFGAGEGTEMRKRIEAGVDRFLDVRGLSDVEAARLMRQYEIDIAVDLMGYSYDCRTGILGFRPAPVQVNYLGFPATMGADHIDYIIADHILISDDERRFYSEQVVTLPETYQANDSKRRVGQIALTRKDAGLPETGFVFACFNNNFKITPDIFAIWMRLLRGVPGSVLWLLEDNTGVTHNLRREAVAQGVEAARLIFASRIGPAEHIARQALADLFLDTLPYTAHTTGSDALFVGLPILTCRGQTFAGRVAASLLHAIGLPELVVSSLEEYERAALRLAQEPNVLAAIRAKLIANRAKMPLFDTARFTRHLEQAYTIMWQRHRDGKPPASFSVSPVDTSV